MLEGILDAERQSSNLLVGVVAHALTLIVYIPMSSELNASATKSMLWLQRDPKWDQSLPVEDYANTSDALVFTLAGEKRSAARDIVSLYKSHLYAAAMNEAGTRLKIGFVEESKLMPYVVARSRAIIVESDRPEGTRMILKSVQKQLPPKQHHFMIIVNPFGGNKRALHILARTVQPMLRDAQATYDVVQTEYRQHAKLLCNQLDRTVYSAIIVVGGDGLLHECINGLVSRKDWAEACALPIGIVPAGTSNAVARSLGLSDPVWATFSILRGASGKQDLVAYEQDGRRLYGHFACMWGLLADIDLGGEAWRCLGRCRLYCCALACILRLKSYPATISYLAADEAVSDEALADDPSSDKPRLRYRDLFQQSDLRITTIKEYSEIYSFLATLHPWLDRDVRISKAMEPPEPGILHLFILPKKPQDGVRRSHLIKAFVEQDSVSLHDNPRLCRHERIRACRVKFLCEERKRSDSLEFPILDVDGEELPRSDLYFECIPNMISLFVASSIK